MKIFYKQSPSVTFRKPLTHELSTNQSLQSVFQDNPHYLPSTPSFPQENRQNKFMKVTSKVVKQLKFDDNESHKEKEEQKTSIMSKIGGLCNCIDTNEDQICKIRKQKKPSRVNLLNLLQMQKRNDQKNKPLTPIGSLVSLLKQ